MARALKTAELIILFFAIPVALAVFVSGGNGRVVIPVLVGMALVCFFFLGIDPSFRKRELVDIHFKASWLKGLGMRLGIGAPILLLSVWIFEPQFLFFLPREMPQIWVMVMCFYPLLSVYPQELIYRTFFFHRYHSLLGDKMPLMIVVNALLFSLAHLFFWNWPAVILTAIGGFVFAYNYSRTKSLLFVCVEHALWGNVIFTIGLGHYFYGGDVTNPVNP